MASTSGAAAQPDLVSAADLGRDGGELDRQVLDAKVAERPPRASSEAAGRRSGRRP